MLGERADGSGRGHRVPEVAIEGGREVKPIPNLGCLSVSQIRSSQDDDNRGKYALKLRAQRPNGSLAAAGLPCVWQSQGASKGEIQRGCDGLATQGRATRMMLSEVWNAMPQDEILKAWSLFGLTN